MLVDLESFSNVGCGCSLVNIPRYQVSRANTRNIEVTTRTALLS
jgi:hypothetical protein